MYSAIGQILLQIKEYEENIFFGIAVPDTREWEKQLIKIPVHIR